MPALSNRDLLRCRILYVHNDASITFHLAPRRLAACTLYKRISSARCFFPVPRTENQHQIPMQQCAPQPKDDGLFIDKAHISTKRIMYITMVCNKSGFNVLQWLLQHLSLLRVMTSAAHLHNTTVVFSYIHITIQSLEILISFRLKRFKKVGNLMNSSKPCSVFWIYV
jgi:hypothetical protein